MTVKINYDTKISDLKDPFCLLAIRNLYKSVLLLKKSDLEDDDYYYLGKAVKLFEKENLSKIDWFLCNEYSGQLTVGQLLNELYNLYNLFVCYSPPDEDTAQFLMSYDFLEEKIKPIVIRKNYFWDDIHKEIKKVSYKKYCDNHYADAVESAFKEVIKRVRDHISKINDPKNDPEIDGDKLMNKVFGCDKQDPIIKFSNLANTAEKDEQRGILYLFKGIVAIRNRKAHENVIVNDSNLTLEYLALASLLMRLLDKVI